jgi:hypothetical protein
MRSAQETSLARRGAAAIAPPFKGVNDAISRLLRPAIGFADPFDVLKDPGLSVAEKRAVLSSWASDACAVEDQPQLRWPLGLEAPIPLAEIREALMRLDRLEARH